MKPFNFVLSAVGAKPLAGIEIGSPFRLVAPNELDARKWKDLTWVDVRNPEAGAYRVTTRDGRSGTAGVDTFLDVLNKYETHPESKALGFDGRVCDRRTIGLLQHRPITAGKIVLVGKEANRLEERSSGELSVNDLGQRLTIYSDDDEWKRFVMPKLRELGARAVGEAVGVSERRERLAQGKLESSPWDGDEVKRIRERSEVAAAKASVVRTAPVEMGVRTNEPATNGNPEMATRRSGCRSGHSTRCRGAEGSLGRRLAATLLVVECR
jgi:hypothetical protein